MIKLVLMLILLTCGEYGLSNDSIVLASEKTKSIYFDKPKQDSKELMHQDMLMLFLLPHRMQINQIFVDVVAKRQMNFANGNWRIWFSTNISPMMPVSRA